MPTRRPMAQPSRLARMALAVLAAGVVAWALSDARFRDLEGFLEGSACLPLSFAAALAIVAVVPGPLVRAGAWLGVLIVGQAASLQLVDAGPAIHYQHLRPVGEMPWIPLVLLVLQAAAVLLGWAPARLRAARALRRLGLPTVLLIGLVSLATAAAPSREVGFYLFELVSAFGLQLLHLATVVLAVDALPPERLTELVPGLHRARERGLDRVVVGAALWVVLASSLFAWASYERVPHVPDEVAYLYQARLLAAGVLTLPAPPVPEAFELYLFDHDTERWWPTTTPGWPAILSLGVLLGVPWLVNPLLGGLGVLLAFTLLRPLLGATDARLASVLLAASPWYLFTSMSLMTHSAMLTAALAAGVALQRAARHRSSLWVFAAGLACGVVGAVRPVDGLVVAALLSLAVGVSRLGWTRLMLLGMGTVLVVSATLAFNLHLTGDPLKNPLTAYSDRLYAPHIEGLGFGPNYGRGWPLDPGPGHGPRDAMINSALNAFSIQTELFGWAIGSIGLVVWAVARSSRRRAVAWLLLPVAAVYVPYFFYYFSGGPDFGARYWYLMVIPLVGLTALGVRRVTADLEVSPAAPVNAVGLLLIAALCTWVPWRAVDKYHHFRGMRADAPVAELRALGNPLILVRGESFPDYASVAIHNPLDWQARAPLFVHEADASTGERLRAAFPDRPVVLLEGPTVTGRGYRLSAPEPSEASR